MPSCRISAYNAGGGKINKGLKRYKTDNFWDLAQKRYLKLETKRYVPKLIAAILISKDPEKYGFTNINYEPPLAYETVEVPRWTSLRAVAVACDTDFEEIQNLNRELRKLITPPDNASYPLKVPAGRKNLVASNLAKVHTSITASYKTHIVRKNETLTRICRKYNLNKTNTLWDKDTPLPSGSGSSQLVLHKVRPGETVTHISRRYNVPVHLIAGWNDLRNIHSIKAGQQIALYLEASHSAGAPSVQSSAQQLHEKTVSAPLYYNVRRGDSLWSIGRRFNVRPETIKLWNNIKNNLIHPGTRLLLSNPESIGQLSMVDHNTRQ
ncbi:MAG: LysM peptidoglycan-binding domain-containing protein [Deltaproteobacteria bacterium]|nr:LysM peptidoglycan-binding domain-containing protein [Deltaproteobacteria bacterium]